MSRRCRRASLETFRRVRASADLDHRVSRSGVQHLARFELAGRTDRYLSDTGRSPSSGSSISTSAAPPVTCRSGSRAGITRVWLTTKRSPGPEDLGQIGDAPMPGVERRPVIDEQPPARRRAARSARLRDSIRRQLVVEVVEAHAGIRLRGTSMALTLCEHDPMSEPRTVQVACDGGDMAMPVWTPESGTGPGLLVIQEIFGVGPYIRAVATRSAEAGYVVGAPDVFWRFAPGWKAARHQAGMDASLEQVGNLDPVAATGRLRRSAGRS